MKPKSQSLLLPQRPKPCHLHQQFIYNKAAHSHFFIKHFHSHHPRSKIPTIGSGTGLRRKSSDSDQIRSDPVGFPPKSSAQDSDWELVGNGSRRIRQDSGNFRRPDPVGSSMIRRRKPSDPAGKSRKLLNELDRADHRRFPHTFSVHHYSVYWTAIRRVKYQFGCPTLAYTPLCISLNILSYILPYIYLLYYTILYTTPYSLPYSLPSILPVPLPYCGLIQPYSNSNTLKSYWLLVLVCSTLTLLRPTLHNFYYANLNPYSTRSILTAQKWHDSFDEPITLNCH